jgi:hypothetical protein
VVVYNQGDLFLGMPVRVGGPTLRLAFGVAEYASSSAPSNVVVNASLKVRQSLVVLAVIGSQCPISSSTSGSTGVAPWIL